MPGNPYSDDDLLDDLDDPDDPDDLAWCNGGPDCTCPDLIHHDDDD